MTITLTVSGRIASVDATAHVVAGNNYPVALSLDSEWTGSLYLRVRFGSLYYDIPFASSDASVDVQMPVGYPEVGIGVFSEALQICSCEARIRLLRSILEAGEQVVEFDSDLYDQWAGEVSELLCDDAFDAESDRPVKNSVITAWKDTVPIDSALVHKAGAETINGNKTFTGETRVENSNIPTLKLVSGKATSTDGWKQIIQFYDGAGSREQALIIGSSDGTSNSLDIAVYNPDHSSRKGVDIKAYADHCILLTTPYYPVDGSSNPQALTANALVASGNIAVDPRLVHTTGNETVAGAKTFTSLLTAGNMAVEDASTPTVTMLKGSTEVANLASDGTQAGLTASSQFFGLRGLGTAPFGQAPSYTADNSADGKIVTRAMLAQTPTVVHTTGSETIAGTKTFSGMLATTKDLGWCRTYTHTLGPGSWAKVYEVKRVANSGGMADIFNDFALDTWRGIEMHWGIGAGSGGYRMSGAIYGNVTTMVDRLVAVMARRASDNVAEIWIGNAQASGNINLVIDCKHVRIEAPIPSEATGDKPVVGSTYSEVVNMNVY